MSSRLRLGTWTAVAWAAPLVWLALVLSARPFDGSVVSSPGAVLGEGRWGRSVTVVETYGDTPLLRGDQILAVQQRDVDAWLTGGEELEAQRGDVLVYRVLRPASGLDRGLELEVPLTAYPVGAAVAAQPHRLVLVLGLLLAGSFLLWRGARPAAAVATLAAGSAAAAGLTAPPFGPGAVALLTRDLTPTIVGEVGVALALGALLVAALWFPRPSPRMRRQRWLTPLVALAPLAGYAVWVSTYAAWQPEAARLQAVLDLTLPAAVTASVVAPVALVAGYRRAGDPRDRVAVRLLVVAALAAGLLAAVLDGVPTLLRGAPLVPWSLLALLVLPLVLACWVTAVLGYRLLEVDALLRRSVVQLVLLTLVGALFLAGVGAVSLTSGGSLRSMVTGGVVVMILLPLALVLRRTVSRLAYGERATPDRVVSRLRRLDPTTGPEEALRETLALLSRSFQLSYAAIEAAGDSAGGRVHISLGELRDQPTSVVLEVAGQPLGRLDMEVSVMRDPFGPRDRRLLEDIGTQVGALVQALVANRELRAAREHLVAAREEERRRLRRDLHDGLGPSLASALMRLEVARELITTDPAGAVDLVGRIADQTEVAIAEIRRLVDGLRPPILDQLGLTSALRAHAAEHNEAALAGRGARLTWSLQADDVGALPAGVEVAAYRIVLEAVTNAVRHSSGSRCDVTLRRDHDALEVEVRDDGRGPGDGPRRGVGTGSMHDRAEELGGTCSVANAPGGGTLVTARLPLTRDGYGETAARASSGGQDDEEGT